MKTKYLIIGLAVAAVLVAGGLILKLSFSGKDATKAAPSDRSGQTNAKVPAAKKTFSKDMGGLTLQALDAKNKPAVLRAKAFRSVDSRSSIYAGSLVSNKTRELAPGSYDIELDTVPQKIYKGIKILAGQETVENLGRVTGILNVKTMKTKNKVVSYPISVYNSKYKNMIIAAKTNRPLELLAGTYDIEVGVLPKVVKTAVTIEPGKENVLDLGIMTGTLIVKAVDDKGMEKKDARQSVKVKKTGTNELIISTKVNRPIEIRQGEYDIEIGTRPPQRNKDVNVNAGEETVLKVIIRAPSKTKAPASAVSSSKIALPAKGR